MAGFVGSNAKKRKRRNYIIVFSAIILLLLFFYTPEFSINQDTPIPDDSILPDPNEEISSLSSSIEDLQLKVLQKNQKISFRDKEIISTIEEKKEKCACHTCTNNLHLTAECERVIRQRFQEIP